MGSGWGVRPAETRVSPPVQEQSASRMLLTTIAAIFLVEAAIMGVLALWGIAAHPYLSLLDASLLVVLVFPALYLFSFRPLMRTLAEHRRVEEELRRSAKTQAALYSVTSAAVSTLDPVNLLDSVIDKVLSAVGADAAWVTMPDPAPDRPPTVLAHRGVSKEFVAAEAESPLSTCPVCQPLLDGEVDGLDLRTLDECPRLPKGILAAAGLKMHLGVPLRASSGGLAILSVAWREARALSDLDRTLLATVGIQLGIALENAHLYRAEQRARRTAETLRKASFALARSLELQTVLDALLEHVARLVPYDRARVMLIDEQSRLRTGAAATADGAVALPREEPTWIDAEADPLIREVLASSKGVIVADTRSPVPMQETARDDFERSWLGVPLMAGNELLGLYTLTKAETGFFTEEHLELGEALAAAAAVAIQNAVLFEQLRSGRERLRTLSRQLVDLQETERRTVARELHDEAGQALTSLLVGLRLLERDASRPGAVTARTAELKLIADGIQENLHRLAANLRPPILDHLGLLAALRHYLEQIDRQHSQSVQFEAVGFGTERLPAPVETALYRIAQEAVLNAVRHGAAERVSVLLERRDRQIVMIIEDDGSGFDPETIGKIDRLGLIGMRERAEMLDGSLLLESAPGAGTTIAVEIPHGA